MVGKYTTLSALTASLGTVTINASGWLVTSGVTGYGTGTSGVFMGYEGGVYKFRVGNPAGNYIGWDGSNLTVIGPQFTLSGGTATFSGALSAATGTFAGNLSAAGGTFVGTLDVKSATTGARTEIKNNVIKVYDSSGVLRVRLGDLSA